MKSEPAYIPTKISQKSLRNLTDIVLSLKIRYKEGFTVADFVQMCSELPLSTIEPIADAFIAKKRTKSVLSSSEVLSEISDDAKAKIESIIAEEIGKKGYPSNTKP